MKERRIGTFTLGVLLLMFGVLFLLQMVVKGISYEMIFRLWPSVFILIGLEVLYSIFQNDKVEFRYDIAAIFILVLLLTFAMGMAGVDYCVNVIHKVQVQEALVHW